MTCMRNKNANYIAERERGRGREVEVVRKLSRDKKGIK